jgi:hypothetical protein
VLPYRCRITDEAGVVPVRRDKELKMADQPDANKRDEIDYFVNGEEQTTSEHKLAVDEILAHAGFTPPAEYELTRDEGHHVFTDGSEVVPIHKDERFTATFNGPTPTS